MKIQISIFLALSIICLTFFSACQKKETASSTNTVFTGEKLKLEAFFQKLSKRPKAQLIDVRTPKEFQEGAIKDAINYDFYSKDFDTNLAKLDKTQPVFLYCKSGGRSNKTFLKLLNMGFKEVYDLEGGYTAWKANNLPQ